MACNSRQWLISEQTWAGLQAQLGEQPYLIRQNWQQVQEIHASCMNSWLMVDYFYLINPIFCTLRVLMQSDAPESGWRNPPSWMQSNNSCKTTGINSSQYKKGHELVSWWCILTGINHTPREIRGMQSIMKRNDHDLLNKPKMLWWADRSLP